MAKRIPASSAQMPGGRRLNAGSRGTLDFASVTAAIVDATNGNILTEDQARAEVAAGRERNLSLALVGEGTIVSEGQIPRSTFDSLIKSGTEEQIYAALASQIGDERARSIASGTVLERQRAEARGGSSLSQAQLAQIQKARDLIAALQPDEDNTNMLTLRTPVRGAFIISDAGTARSLGFPTLGGVQQTRVDFGRAGSVRGAAELLRRIRQRPAGAGPPSPAGGSTPRPTTGRGGTGALDNIGG